MPLGFQVLCAAFENGVGRKNEGDDVSTAGIRRAGGVGEQGDFEPGDGAGGERLEDLVHAAWGVYETSKDEEDLVDSLARITRLAVRPPKP